MRDSSPFPARLHVETTSACNQRCRFCTHPTMDRTKRHMPVELFEKIALEAGAHRARMWLHFLGEPLLHPRIFDLVAFAKRAGAPEVGFSSNAVLLTRERLDPLFDSGLDRLEISIDASTREGYLAMRGTDDFETVTKNVRELLADKRARRAARPTITLAFLDAGHEPADRRRFVAEWAALLDEPDFLMAIPAISFGGSVPAALPDREREPCHWLSRATLVLSNGDVVTCATDYRGERVLGNLVRESLADIWNGSAYRELRALHDRGAYAGVALCDTCRDWVHSDGRGYVNFSRSEDSSRSHPTD